jgi:hypothetical protein
MPVILATGGRDQEDHSLNPAQANSSWEKTHHKKGLVEWLILPPIGNDSFLLLWQIPERNQFVKSKGISCLMISEASGHGQLSPLFCACSEAAHLNGTHSWAELLTSWHPEGRERQEGARVPISLSRACLCCPNFFPLVSISWNLYSLPIAPHWEPNLYPWTFEGHLSKP